MFPDTCPVLDEFFAAVEGRDASAVAACFTAEAYYAPCVPQPERRGRNAIEGMFSKVLGDPDRVVWEVSNSAFSGSLVWLERLDRFWFRGAECAIECVGVFDIDWAQELIRGVRDYCDLSVWKERYAAATRSQGT